MKGPYLWNYNLDASDWSVRVYQTDEGWCLHNANWRTGEKTLTYYSSLGEALNVATSENGKRDCAGFPV